MELNISGKNLTSLVGLVPDGITKLYCSFNRLTSLEGCPDSLTTLDCAFNRLTSLKGCPNSVTTLDCTCNQLTSLEGCSDSVVELYCRRNNDLDLYLLPDSVKELIHSSDKYKDMKLDEIREINKYKKRSLTTKSAKNR